MSHHILVSFFKDTPMLVVAFGAIVVAFVFWRRAPLSSLLLVLACICSLVLLIAYPVAYELVVHSEAGSGYSRGRIDLAFQVCWSIFKAGYLILLVVAIYAGRKQL
jgi:hypothetical protein